MAMGIEMPGRSTIEPIEMAQPKMKRVRRWLVAGLLVLTTMMLTACGGDEVTATRTPIPTWTPTVAASGDAAADAPGVVAAPGGEIGSQVVDAGQVAAAIATETPTPLPTATPEPTPTPPEPTYAFELEAAEKFPTDTLAPNVVRIYAYIYAPEELGLDDYSLRVARNGVPLTVENVTAAGLPTSTRAEPGPYTRFTNFNVIFVEPQAGEWRIEPIDSQGNLVGPEAIFNLTADEATRELYVRYVRRPAGQ